MALRPIRNSNSDREIRLFTGLRPGVPVAIGPSFRGQEPISGSTPKNLRSPRRLVRRHGATRLHTARANINVSRLFDHTQPALHRSGEDNWRFHPASQPRRHNSLLNDPSPGQARCVLNRTRGSNSGAGAFESVQRTQSVFPGELAMSSMLPSTGRVWPSSRPPSLGLKGIACSNSL